MKNNIRFMIGLLIVLFSFFDLGLIWDVRAENENYPNKPVQLLIPWGAGSAADLNSRILAPLLQNYFKQPFVVINKAGGGGIIGHTIIAQSKPDGYIIGQVSTAFGVFFLAYKNLKFNMESFVPICGFASIPAYFMVKADAPWKTLKEFVADAKKNPGKLRYSTHGVASRYHVIALAFCEKAGINLTHIPHSGTGDVITSVLGGHVDMAISSGPGGGHLKAGTVRALGVAEKERVRDLPEVPTLIESGYPVVLTAITGHVVPKDTPKEIVKRLVRGYIDVLNANKAQLDPEMRRFEQTFVIMGPDEYWKDARENYEDSIKVFKGGK
jgi:tripartite-type tricarboxylate transporter receptor subunit TctC